jgi:zona occludens toxin (predicted ATPase)
MIEVFEGKLGGGKTYSAVVRILDTLRKGGVVATNIELNREHCCQWIASKFGVILDWDRQVYVLDEASIFEFHKHVPCGATTPSLVVIDEAHLWFNAREWKSASKDVLTFLTQSRKIRADIIFITQDAKNLDGQFRRMVQFIWRFRDLDRWKVPILGIPF